MATHSSVIAWRIPWTEEPGRLQSMGSQESDTTERLKRQRGGNNKGGLNIYFFTKKLYFSSCAM